MDPLRWAWRIWPCSEPFPRQRSSTQATAFPLRRLLNLQPWPKYSYFPFNRHYRSLKIRDYFDGNDFCCVAGFVFHPNKSPWEQHHLQLQRRLPCGAGQGWRWLLQTLTPVKSKTCPRLVSTYWSVCSLSQVLYKTNDDHVTVIGAGVTLHEALAAAEMLKKGRRRWSKKTK